MIELNQVSKEFSDKNGSSIALNSLSFTISSGERFGIIGESGAGKSTLLRMMNALEVPTSGELLINGVSLQTLSKKEIQQMRQGIGMVFQQVPLLMNKTVEENILLPVSLHPTIEPHAIEELLRFTGLLDKRNSYPASLSGGQRQRVGIARALVLKPSILLCDEPTSALDVQATNEIVSLLLKSQETFGMTLVIVSHELAVVKALCERVALMEQGTLKEIISIEKPLESTVLSRSYIEEAKAVLTNG